MDLKIYDNINRLFSPFLNSAILKNRQKTLNLRENFINGLTIVNLWWSGIKF
jgi:hypothetical protein